MYSIAVLDPCCIMYDLVSLGTRTLLPAVLRSGGLIDGDGRAMPAPDCVIFFASESVPRPPPLLQKLIILGHLRQCQSYRSPTYRSYQLPFGLYHSSS